MPQPIAQNMKIVSIGSFTAVLKRTMDSAPTIPNVSAILDATTMMINAVTIDNMIKEVPKLLTKITPEKVSR